VAAATALTRSSASASAAKPAETPLKPGWSEHTDASGKTYYANIKTGESSWDRPTDPGAAAAALLAARAAASKPAVASTAVAASATKPWATALPTASAATATFGASATASAATKPASEPPLKPGWSEHKDTSGKTYYANIVTGESSWDRPSQPPAVPPAPVPPTPAFPVGLGASKLAVASAVAAPVAAVAATASAATALKPVAPLPTAAAAPVPPVPTAAAKPAAPPPLKAGWAEHTDPQGKTYYANTATGESSWDRPSDPGAAAAALLAAAAASKPAVASAVAAPAPRGRWDKDSSYALGPEGSEHKFQGKATLLDKDKHSSLVTTVDKLNAGLIPADAGYCVMFSFSRQQYFLLWRSDKEQEAYTRLDIRDTGTLHWAAHLAKPLGPKGSEYRFQGRALLLNTSIYSSVADTVSELNSGRIRVDQGFCVIFSSSKTQYFLIYAQGKEHMANNF